MTWSNPGEGGSGGGIPIGEKGAASGVATLDSGGDVPLAQLGNAVGGGGGARSVTVLAAASGITPLSFVAAGAAYDVTLVGNWAPTFSGANASVLCELDLLIGTDIVGGHAIAWPGGVVWLSGGAPPTITVGTVRLVSLVSFDGGTTWYGA